MVAILGRAPCCERGLGEEAYTECEYEGNVERHRREAGYAKSPLPPFTKGGMGGFFEPTWQMGLHTLVRRPQTSMNGKDPKVDSLFKKQIRPTLILVGILRGERYGLWDLSSFSNKLFSD